MKTETLLNLLSQAFPGKNFHKDTTTKAPRFIDGCGEFSKVTCLSKLSGTVTLRAADQKVEWLHIFVGGRVFTFPLKELPWGMTRMCGTGGNPGICNKEEIPVRFSVVNGFGVLQDMTRTWRLEEREYPPKDETPSQRWEARSTDTGEVVNFGTVAGNSSKEKLAIIRPQLSSGRYKVILFKQDPEARNPVQDSWIIRVK